MASKFNIKDQLAGIAALIAAIVAIGGGFVKYGEITTKLDAIEAREQIVIDTSAIESGIAVLQEKVAALENKEEVVVDLSGIESNISGIESGLAQNKTKSLVNEKEIELLKVQIEEIKVSTSNPLSN
jgi:precorrin isomerase